MTTILGGNVNIECCRFPPTPLIQKGGWKTWLSGVCRKVPSTLGLETEENQPRVWRSGSGILEPPPHLWKCTPSLPQRVSHHIRLCSTFADFDPTLSGFFFTGVTIFPTLILIFSDWYFYSTWSLKKYRIQVHKMFRKCDPSFFTCCPWNDFWKSSHQNSLQSWDTAACSPADSDGAHSPARGWETRLPFDWGQSRHIVL